MNLYPSPVTSVYQMHSSDFLLRMPAAALGHIVWEHLFTVEDPSVLGPTQAAGVRAGFTEWQAACSGRTATLCWDWIALSDGALQVLPEVGPRTNLRLLDARGYDLDAATECDQLLTFIRSLDWAASAARCLRHGA